MPVLYSHRNIDAITGVHFNSILAPFLIVATACNTDKDLSSAFRGMMDMPVVSATGFEGYIEDALYFMYFAGAPFWQGHLWGEAVGRPQGLDAQRRNGLCAIPPRF